MNELDGCSFIGNGVGISGPAGSFRAKNCVFEQNGKAVEIRDPVDLRSALGLPADTNLHDILQVLEKLRSENSDASQGEIVKKAPFFERALAAGANAATLVASFIAMSTSPESAMIFETIKAFSRRG